MMNNKPEACIRRAVPGEEEAIHNAHMRSIREVCVKDHGEEEIKGWGYRPLGDRWIEAIKNDFVLVVEYRNEIYGVGHIKPVEKNDERYAYLYALYFTPDVIGLGLAKEMLEIFFENVRSWGIDVIKLDSTITAYSFYKKYGFQDNGEMQKVEIGGYPVTCYPMICYLK